MNECTKKLDTLDMVKFIAKDLEPEEEERIGFHIGVCVPCSREYMKIREIMETYKEKELLIREPIFGSNIKRTFAQLKNYFRGK